MSGCGLKNTQEITTYESFLPILTTNSPNLKEPNKQNYLIHYFKPWKEALHVNKESALWPWNVYKPASKYYGENLLPRNHEWFDRQLKNAQLDKIGSLSQNAIMLKTTYVSNFPSNLPLFKNPNIAGEGFPFDHGQNSRIFAFSPIKLSHYSLDGMWAFVEADSFFGWVEASNVLPLTQYQQNKFINSSKVIAIKEFNLSHPKGFYTNIPIGTLLPLNEKGESFMFLPSGDSIQLPLENKSVANWPLKATSENLLNLSQSFLDEPYGWGGMFGRRDCSALTKDFFAPFGIWLPRNSMAQFHQGSKIYLTNASPKEKETMISNFAIPFLSLIYLPGHIMLYTGNLEDSALALHNTWGIKTMDNGKEGRYIIGKAILSDLHVEKNFSNTLEQDNLISKIEGFSTLDELSPKERLLKAYPNAIKEISDNLVLFHDGTSLPFSSQKTLNPQNIYDKTDIQGQFIHPYPLLTPLQTPTTDPGRFRNEEFFKALYGGSKEEIENNLVSIHWLPSHTNITLQFNKKHGAAKALQNVSNALDKLPEKYISFLDNPAGSYNYRKIAKTDRLSMHSFGIAIDINTKSGDYWQWSKTEEYQNKIPQEIVNIFESNGFIWGGRWKHFDTFHFEYRPELTIP